MEKVLSQIKKIHFVGISGAGMSGLARLFYDKGVVVTGSDLSIKGYLCGLDKLVSISRGHNADNVLGADLVCFSSAISHDNEELRRAEELNVPIMHRAELLALLLEAKASIAVSGAHGKTTVTALLSYVLKILGDEPSAIIGGIPLDGGCNAWWGSGHFVFEADESDGSFLRYTPKITVITNIDDDHLDYYSDIESIYNAFRTFAKQTTDKVIVCGDDELAAKIGSTVDALCYGLDEKNAVRAERIVYTDSGINFDVIASNVKANVSVGLFGLHNVYNVLAVLSVAVTLGYKLDVIARAISGFSGIQRRLQLRSVVDGVAFFDDYAHHPTEITAVISALRRVGDRRIVVLFQPHRFSRIERLYDKFIKCFKGADTVIIMDVYGASEKRCLVDYDRFRDDVSKESELTVYYYSQDKLIDGVIKQIKTNDIVVGVGAGDVTDIIGCLADKFRVLREF